MQFRDLRHFFFQEILNRFNVWLVVRSMVLMRAASSSLKLGQLHQGNRLRRQQKQELP